MTCKSSTSVILFCFISYSTFVILFPPERKAFFRYRQVLPTCSIESLSFEEFHLLVVQFAFLSKLSTFQYLIQIHIFQIKQYLNISSVWGDILFRAIQKLFFRLPNRRFQHLPLHIHFDFPSGVFCFYTIRHFAKPFIRTAPTDFFAITCYYFSCVIGRSGTDCVLPVIIKIVRDKQIQVDALWQFYLNILPVCTAFDYFTERQYRILKPVLLPLVKVSQTYHIEFPVLHTNNFNVFTSGFSADTSKQYLSFRKKRLKFITNINGNF